MKFVSRLIKCGKHICLADKSVAFNTSVSPQELELGVPEVPLKALWPLAKYVSHQQHLLHAQALTERMLMLCHPYKPKLLYPFVR